MRRRSRTRNRKLTFFSCIPVRVGSSRRDNTYLKKEWIVSPTARHICRIAASLSPRCPLLETSNKMSTDPRVQSKPMSRFSVTFPPCKASLLSSSAVREGPRPASVCLAYLSSSGSAKVGQRMDKQQLLELIPDYVGEDRHEFVARLAYRLWEERGRPFGSPEVDWFRAEHAVYASLLGAGLITQS